MSDVIATRVLECTHNGKRETVEIALGVPRAEENYFVCDYEISFDGRTKAYKIAGLDSMHALQLAICMLGSSIADLPETDDWTWNGEAKTGLPKKLDEPMVGF